MDATRDAQRQILSLCGRRRHPLPKRSAGSVGVEETRGKATGVWTRAALGEDAERILPRHQSAGRVPNEPVHVSRPHVPTALKPLWRQVNAYLVRWMQRKYKRLARGVTRAARALGRVAKSKPKAFVHWEKGFIPAAR